MQTDTAYIRNTFSIEAKMSAIVERESLKDLTVLILKKHDFCSYLVKKVRRMLLLFLWGLGNDGPATQNRCTRRRIAFLPDWSRMASTVASSSDSFRREGIPIHSSWHSCSFSCLEIRYFHLSSFLLSEVTKFSTE